MTHQSSDEILSDDDSALVGVLQELGYTPDEAAAMLLWHQLDNARVQ